MNLRAIIYVLGWVLNIEGIFLMFPFLVSLIYGEPEGTAFLKVAVLCIVLGTVIIIKKPKNMSFLEKDGLVIASSSWIILSLFGALPFVLSGDIPNYTNALFETVSGFTTTGSSILSDVEALAKCSIFWRSFTHWIGGMGVLVFLLAIMPLTKDGSPIYLMRAESPGPVVDRLLPKVQNTAFILYAMYVVLTIAEVILLILGKMPLFDSLTIAFGTAGTGGFAIKNSGFADYTPYVQWVVGIFMMLFGINFSVYFLLYLKKWTKALKYEEMHHYLLIIIIATAIISLSIYKDYNALEPTVRHAFFQVSSIITTTGFATADFDLWPSVAKVILITIMFIGACAGSTGGGMKVSRITTLIKSVKKELIIYMHPGSVKKIKADGKVVTHETQRAINVFFVLYILIFVISVFLVSLENSDVVTSFTAVSATLNNIGPGLSKVGPMCNFSHLSNLSKYVLMFDMLAGRLELYPMLLIFNVAMWKRTFSSKIRRIKNK